MAKYCVTNGNLFDGTASTLVVNGGATLRVQANVPSGDSVSYSVQGKLTSNGTNKTISGVSDNGLTVVTTITDDGIYSFDTTGYYSVTVSATASGSVRIYGTIYAD